MTKTSSGRHFEDFFVGQDLPHATPRTVTAGDAALYAAIYGSRFPLQSSAPFAQNLGYPGSPVDDLLTFHFVFGKSVPDISLNAVANLGYADGRFLKPVFVGDTLAARSQVIGLKENSDGKTGVVYVRTTGRNQHGDIVLDYARWVMVRKAHADGPAITSGFGRSAPAGPQSRDPIIPSLPQAVTADQVHLPDGIDFGRYDFAAAGSPHAWDDYAIGEKIDHVDGMTIESADHMSATRMYQNTARVHFNQFTESRGRFGHRIVYGGHIISLARALSFNGLGNAGLVLAINGGRHTNPCFAGDTIFAWSEVLDKTEIPGRADAGLLRLRLVATKDLPVPHFPYKTDDGAYHANVVLDFDYWAVLPRR